MDDFPEFETYEDVIDSYNSGVAVKPGESLTDYIKRNNIKIKEIDISPLSDLKNLKDGGPVGIEILFTEKVPAAPSQLVSESDILLGYRGDAAYRSGSEQSKSIGQGNVGSQASFGGGQGTDSSGQSEGAGGVNPNQYTSNQQNVNNIKAQLGIKDPNLLQKTFNKYNSLSLPVKAGINTMVPAELMKLFQVGNVLNTGYNQLKKPILTEEDITLEPGKLPELTLGMTDNPLPSENLLADATTTPTGGKLGLNLMDYGTLNNAGYTDTQIEELQNNPNINTEEVIRDIKGPIFAAADGGRVGFFMGGPALEGEALSIYNSMNAYGNTDQQIADKLQSLGMYTPPGSTPDTPDTPQTVNQLGYVGRGDDNPYAGLYVDQTDYGFNKKNYGPGQKLEINPAAVGMSFYDSTTGTSTPNKTVKEDKGIIGRTIDSFMGAAIPEKQLSQFTSPTTGGTLKGPAELGFMSQNIEGIPGNLTREDLRGMYDNYNKFLGRSSNFADARVKGTAGNLIDAIPYVGTIKRGAESLFGPRGNKSLRSKYTVDNVGFGNTGMRDEFGLFTGQRNDGFLGILGKPTGPDYVDRMNERLGELDDFFGSRIEGFDINNLTPDMLNQMSKINGFYTKQIQAYKQRLATENINRNTQDAIKAQAEAKKKEEAAFQAQLNETQRQQRMSDLQRVERAYREDTGGGGGSYATGESGVQSDGSYNDPFDPGGGEKDGGFIDGYNRRKYSEGGLATMFTRRR